jgi:hypothetical protein
MISIKLQLTDELRDKLQGACSELTSLNPSFKHTTESISILLLDMIDYDEILEKVLLFQDKALQMQIKELKELQKKVKEKGKVSEEKK